MVLLPFRSRVSLSALMVECLFLWQPAAAAGPIAPMPTSGWSTQDALAASLDRHLRALEGRASALGDGGHAAFASQAEAAVSLLCKWLDDGAVQTRKSGLFDGTDEEKRVQERLSAFRGHAMRALFDLGQGKLGDAGKRTLRRVADNGDEDGNNRDLAAFLLYRMGEKAILEAKIKESLAQTKSNKVTEQLWGWAHLFEVYAHVGERSQAMQALAELRRVYPTCLKQHPEPELSQASIPGHGRVALDPVAAAMRALVVRMDPDGPRLRSLAERLKATPTPLAGTRTQPEASVYVFGKDGTLRPASPEEAAGARRVQEMVDVRADVDRARAALGRRDTAAARTALDAVVQRGPSIGAAHTDAILSVALLDASEGRRGEALRRLAEVNAKSPTADGLLFEMQLACLDPAEAARAARTASRLAVALRQMAATDRGRAARLLREALTLHCDPDVLVGAATAAVRIAAQAPVPRDFFPGYVGGRVYLEDLQEAQKLTRRGALAIQNQRWLEASDSLFKARVSAEAAHEGHPQQSAVLVPLLYAATAATYVLAGRVEEAQFHAGEALRKARTPVQRDEANRLANLLSELRRSGLDRSQTEAQADGEAAATAAQAAAQAAASSLFGYTITNGYTFR